MTKFSVSHNRVTKFLIASEYINFGVNIRKRVDLSLFSHLCNVANSSDCYRDLETDTIAAKL